MKKKTRLCCIKFSKSTRITCGEVTAYPMSGKTEQILDAKPTKSSDRPLRTQRKCDNTSSLHYGLTTNQVYGDRATAQEANTSSDTYLVSVVNTQLSRTESVSRKNRIVFILPIRSRIKKDAEYRTSLSLDRYDVNELETTTWRIPIWQLERYKTLSWCR